MRFARHMMNRRAWRRATKQAEGSDQVVCATLKPDGTPVYFVAPRDATDSTMRELAFAEVNGRPMSEVEKSILKVAEDRHVGR